MGRMRWLTQLAVAVLAVGWLAGCSSSSDSSSMESAGSTANYAGEMDTASSVESAEAPAAADAAMEAEMPASEEPMSVGVGSGTQALPTAAQTSRMLIYTANLAMEVEDYGGAYSEIQNLIHLSGGYLIGFQEETSRYEKTGLFTIKVPAGGFSGFLDKLEKLPNLSLNRSMQAQDVSEEYVDLEARLRAKQVVEQRLLEFMEKATGTDDLVTFSNELGRVQEEIERMKGRMRYLEQNVAYSTVELRVYEKLADGSATIQTETKLGSRMADAVQGSLNVLVTVSEGVLIVVAGLIPIAAAATIVGVPVYWVWKRRRKDGGKSVPPNENL